MPIPLDAPEVLNREFLLVRAKILEIAASLDRLDRAAGSVADDARMDQIRRALNQLQTAAADRAEQVQMIFSLPYDENWQARFAGDLGQGPVAPAAPKPR